MENSNSKPAYIADLARNALRSLWSEDGTLRQKTLRGVLWVAGSAVATNLLQFVQRMILVRLLVAADFGVMCIAGFVLGAIATFSRMGLEQALIQRKEISSETLNTAWTLTFVRNIALYFIIFLCAPWVARFYANALICLILRVVSLQLIFQAFSNNVGLVLLRKELDFRRHELLEATCNACSIGLTIGAAFWLRSVWAIVIGQLGRAAMRFVGTYIVHPYRPRPHIDWSRARSLLGFGRHILVAGIVLFLHMHLDDAILGRMLGMTALGLYALAYTLSNMPATLITATISGVMLSAYSKLQDDRERLGAAFLRTLRVNAAISIPAAAGLAVLAPEIVKLIYTPRYAAMIPCFTVLCIFGLARSLGAIAGPVFNAVGKPYLVGRLVTVNLVVMLALIYPLTKARGIEGTAWATVIPMVPVNGVALWLASTIGRVPKRAVARVIGEIGLITIVMMAVVYLYKSLYHTVSPLDLIGYVLLGFGVYCLGIMLCCKETSRTMLSLLGQPTGGVRTAREEG